MFNQNVFDEFLTFVNLYQHETISSICSGEIVDLKILQSDWLRAFWPTSLEQDFSQYRICARTQQIVQIFIIEQILLGFPKFVPACKKISSFHQFILVIKSILESHDQTGHSHY